jgi:hypothetical protein
MTVTDSWFLAAARRNAALIDLLNGLCQRHARLGNRLLKGTEVNDDQINGYELMTIHLPRCA